MSGKRKAIMHGNIGPIKGFNTDKTKEYFVHESGKHGMFVKVCKRCDVQSTIVVVGMEGNKETYHYRIQCPVCKNYAFRLVRDVSVIKDINDGKIPSYSGDYEFESVSPSVKKHEFRGIIEPKYHQEDIEKSMPKLNINHKKLNMSDKDKVITEIDVLRSQYDYVINVLKCRLGSNCIIDDDAEQLIRFFKGALFALNNLKNVLISE